MVMIGFAPPAIPLNSAVEALWVRVWVGSASIRRGWAWFGVCHRPRAFVTLRVYCENMLGSVMFSFLIALWARAGVALVLLLL